MPSTAPSLSTADVAVRLGVSRRTVLDYIHAGKLPATRFSSRVIRVSEDDLRTFVSTSRVAVEVSR